MPDQAVVLTEAERRLIELQRERNAIVYDHDHEHLVEDARGICPVGMKFSGGDIVVRRVGNYAVLRQEF